MVYKLPCYGVQITPNKINNLDMVYKLPWFVFPIVYM